MSAQEQRHPESARARHDDDDTADTTDAPPAATTAGAQAADRDAEVDALLDEIDDVLETNAEEFVAAFVQKGGQ